MYLAGVMGVSIVTRNGNKEIIAFSGVKQPESIVEDNMSSTQATVMKDVFSILPGAYSWSCSIQTEQ